VFVECLRSLAKRAKSGGSAQFLAAPHYTPRRRLDETRAARQPVLRWKPPVPASEAAD
jgi:glycine dehydrogenase subunit 2